MMASSYPPSHPERGDEQAGVPSAARRMGVRPETRGEAQETDRPPADLATIRAEARPRLDGRPRPPPDVDLVTVNIRVDRDNYMVWYIELARRRSGYMVVCRCMCTWTWQVHLSVEPCRSPIAAVDNCTAVE